MAVKIFCNACQKYIRDAKNRNEIVDLTGKEICQDCEQSIIKILAEVERVSKRSITSIQGILGKCKADVEDMLRKVIHGEDKQDLG